MNTQVTGQAIDDSGPLGVLLVNLGTPDSPSVADVRNPITPGNKPEQLTD